MFIGFVEFIEYTGLRMINEMVFGARRKIKEKAIFGTMIIGCLK